MKIVDTIKNIIFKKKELVVEGRGSRSSPLSVYRPVFGDVPPPWKSSDYLKSAEGWVYAAVSAIANEVATIDLHLYQKKGDEMKEIFEHDLLTLLYKVNNFTTKFDHFASTQQYLELAGEAPWLLERNKAKEIVAVYLLRPDKLEIKYDSEKLIGGYTYNVEGGGKLEFEKDDIILIRYPDPVKLLRGCGTLSAVRRTFDIDRYSEEWNKNFFYNSARPDAVLTTDGKLTDEQLERLRKQWEKSYRGLSNSSKLAIFEAGLKYTPMQLSQKDMDFLEQQKFTRDKILSIFRVPKTVVAITDDVNLANARMAAYSFAKWTIRPKMKKLVEQLNEFLVPFYGDDLYLDFTDPVPEDYGAKIKKYVAALGQSGWMTINEVRALENLEPIEGGDAVLRMGMEVGRKQEKKKKQTLTPTEMMKRIMARENKIQKKFDENIKILVKSFMAEKSRKKGVKDKAKKKVLEGLNQIKKDIESDRKEKLEKIFWEKQVKIADRHEARMIAGLKDLFREQEEEVLEKLKKKEAELQGKRRLRKELRIVNDYWKDLKTSVPRILLDVRKETKKFATLLVPIMFDTIKEEGQHAIEEVDKELEYDAESAEAAKFLRQKPLLDFTSVNKTTNKLIKAEIVAGIDEGEGVDKIARRISRVFSDADRKRSLLIARTETQKAVNFATVDAYRQSGVVSGKKWLTAFDERTCFLKNTKVMTRSGEKNIQDIKVGELVKTPKGYQKVLKTFQRDYKGLFVGIRVGNKKVVMTANHPVWTKRGWIRADSLRIGDFLQTVKNKLIQVNGIVHFKFFDADSSPAVFFQEGVTAGIFSGISMPEISIGLNSNSLFQNSKINTISSDLAFRDKMNFQSFKTFTNSFFKRCFASIFAIARKTTELSFFNPRRKNTKFLSAGSTNSKLGRSTTGFGTISSIRTISAKSFSTSFAGLVKRFRKPTFSTANSITRSITFRNKKNFSAYWADFLNTIRSIIGILAFPTTEFLCVLATQKRVENSSTLFALPSKRLVFSGSSIFSHIFNYNIKDKKNQWLLAKVYNLEVENENVYYANGLLVHNCERCMAMNGKIVDLDKNYFNKGDTFMDIKFDYEDIGYPPLHARCYDKETEIYTKDGWKLFKDVEKKEKVLTLNPETKDLEWSGVKETVKYKVDKILSLTNKQHSFDMRVSENHPFFGYKRVDRGKKGRIVEPRFYDDIKDLPKSEFKFYVSSQWKGRDRRKIDINGVEFKIEDFCKLMGYFLSEGSVTRRNRQKSRFQISIAQEKYLLEMWDDLKDLPVRKIYLGKDKIFIIDNRLGRYLEKFGKSNKKFIPDEIKELSGKYIRIFLDAFRLGDGSIRKGNNWKNADFNDSSIYFTSSKRMADDLGELIIKCGKSVSYHLNRTKGIRQRFKNGTYKINNDQWKIFELSSRYRMLDKINIRRENYNDYVYDVEVEKNNTILVRRNGRVAWGSNCRCTVTPVIARSKEIDKPNKKTIKKFIEKNKRD